MDNNLHIETLLANTPSVDGSGIAPVTGAIYQTSSFINNGKTPYSYTRCDNPTRSALEERCACWTAACARSRSPADWPR